MSSEAQRLGERLKPLVKLLGNGLAAKKAEEDLDRLVAIAQQATAGALDALRTAKSVMGHGLPGSAYANAHAKIDKALAAIPSAQAAHGISAAGINKKGE
jgi:hypothetical protein